MSYRKLFAFVFVCALAFGGPAFLQAAGGGAATNIHEGICYWSCNGGGVGSAPVSRPEGRNCLNACRAACGGPCIALY